MRTKALHILSILLLTIGSASVSRAEIKILGNVYGGGDQAAVKGKTSVEINKGQYAGDIFGGGNGALNNDGTVKASADVGTHYDGMDGVHEAGDLVEGTGTTSVTINGGKFIVEQKAGDPATDPEVGKFLNNNNVYGGGNLACNVFGSTAVALNTGMLPTELFAVDNTTDPANPTNMYRKWGEYIGRIEGMTAAKVPDTPEKAIQGSVFGAGYGVHTSVLGNTSVNIAIGTSTPINTKDEILAQYNLAKRGGDATGETLASQFVITVFGGGYDGTVGGNTDVQISGSPMLQNVFGGGLGSKSGAEASGGYASTVGTVSGSTSVAINGGTVYNNVYGGGAGIFGEQEITIPERGTAKMPYYMASMVHQQTDVTISNGTIVFGNVYGGGDIANTGWYDEASRPTGIHAEYVNASKAKLDLTTALHLEGGNVMGMVFGGGNGRKKAEIDRYNFVGAVIGNTSVVLGKKNDETWEPGTKVWNNIYGGGQSGSVYSCAVMAGYNSTTGTEARSVVGRVDGCTNVEIYNGDVGNNIFGGGWGDDPDGSDANKTSADISGNTYVYFEHGYIITDFYWDQEYCDFLEQYCGEPKTNKYEDQIGKHTRSDLSHNLYGGGNVACVIGTKRDGNLVGGTGNVTVYMIGAPSVDSQNFYTSDYYLTSLDILGSLHFSAFGGGFGMNAKVLGNINNNIALKSAGLYSIVGGGMNGTVDGICRTVLACKYDPAETNPLRNTRLHNVYGGGYYAPVGGAELNIAEAFITDNVFGGGVMGNIDPANIDMTKAVTKTTIGLLDGKSFTVKGDDGSTTYTYAYNDHRNRIYIGGNVYGGNDVSGTVNGVAKLNIHGGTIGHNVYGAGNGDHIGYYVPNELLYDLGAHGIDNYFPVVHHEPGAPNGNTYVGRPQTIGGVELTLEGNTTNERVTVLGQVFGGGNSCTIGAWDKTLLTSTYFSNPHLVRDDPAYFLGGGKIDMNLGSHITIGRTHAQLAAAADGTNYLIDVDGKLENVSGLYMGCSGHHLATQDWAKTNNYYHHFYDTETGKYWPGFAVYKDGSTTELLTRQEGQQSFLAYMNNILVWSDDVNLNIDKDADDIWIANFVGGGFRGSMKAKTQAGQFHYTLPRGVTIGHDVIGGAFNTDVVYRIFETSDGHTYAEENGHYKYLTDDTGLTSDDADDDPTTGDYHHIERDKDGNITSIVRFYYDGGMLSELAYGTQKADNTRIDRILKKYSAKIGQDVTQDVRKDFAGGSQGTAEAFPYYKRDALVYLELDNHLQVEYVDGHVHGGNVFGGCFSSGRVEGDIWTDYRCFQESDQAFSEDFNLSDTNFNNAKNFEENFAMMLFGAGYGKNTNIQGSTYIRVLHPEKNPNAPIEGMAYGYPRLYNVFGGSYEGKVEGNTNIYFNPGKYGYVTGAIYGGGCNGYVGGKTFLELAGGYIDEAYGGARNANIGGGTHIWAYDGQKRWWGEDVPNGIDGEGNPIPMAESQAEKAPLFIGKLYGGTDISGQICTDEGGTYTLTKGYQPYYSASYWPKELYTNHVDNTNGMTYIDSYLQVGGTERSDNGYPVIGAVYAAGNGENTKAFFEAKYAETNKEEDRYNDDKLPHMQTAMMEFSDGNIVYVFGGGNKATVKENNYILVRSKLDGKHTIENLDERMYDVMKRRIFSVAVDCYHEKLVDGKKVLDLKNASIQRLFGGNNIATMSIQPKWQLISGRINNVYSGGNMGDMTYYNEAGKPATTDGTITGSSGVEFNADGSNSNYTPRGLSITIEHPDIHIGSLYGGCRISDVIPGGYKADGVTPLKKDEFAESEDYYGATVNITDGYIENVYGGNDISGKVHFGTNVNISGAVSGNVYGSGNGFYLYKWDTQDTQITEHLLKEFDTEASDKALCYTVPVSAGLNDTQKLIAINNARPSVEKAFLNIAGLEHYPMGDNANPKRVAYVKGNVFCGGNASTITGNNSFSKFKIGSYVTLNGVFMGSDGYEYTQNDQIARFAKINQFTDMGAATVASAFPYPDDANHYKILLDVYMMAVEMKAQPKDFNLKLPLKEAHIGTYCGGGNRGSMLVDKTVSLPFHHDIIIYDKIVAACLDSNVKYNQNGTIITSNGGYTRKIADNATYGNTKMRLDIASQFVPLVMDVPDNKNPETLNAHGENFETAKTHDFLYRNQTKGVKYTYQEFNELFEPDPLYESQEQFEETEGEEHQWKEAPGIYAPSCNIYGGCYQSGEVEGDIELNIHTNMLRYVNKEDLEKSIAHNIACFNVYGAGFGQDSHVWGNVTINMDRSLDHDLMGEHIASPTLSDELINELTDEHTIEFNIEDGALNNKYGTRVPNSYDCSYPSANNIIGGGRNGKLIGNTTVGIRNGLVFSDVAGGCYASDMYGSTHVIIGYPKYYKCLASGEYQVDRADKWNTTKKDGDGNDIIKQSIWYLKGDLVPDNIYQQITDGSKNTKFELVDIQPVNGKNTPTHTNKGIYDGTTWDDIVIKIGKGIYGGGYSLANSTAASAGSITTHKLLDDEATTKDIHPHNFFLRYGYDETTFAGYGGNSSIMLGDQDGGAHDHIRISTLKAAVATIPAESSVIGKFVREADGRYTHQGDHTPVLGETYYTLTGDGGIYGDGHLTFCEGFRTADVTRYGWADGTAKHPILMNTFQRMDLLSVNDCCLMLQGAQDFATDQIDATIYSITRINEMRLNSSLNANSTLGQISAHQGAGEGTAFDTAKQRNYLAFFNNVHYLGSIVTNDEFNDGFHNNQGAKTSDTYYSKKLQFITDYTNSTPDAEGHKTAEATTLFKQRNVATARNAIGINNGYCLRIQNQEYEGTGASKVSKTYYGPIVGVCEVKLLTLVQGEGGGYVYADNIHEHAGTPGGEDHFLMTSGNFVFPGIIEQGVDAHGDPIGDQYIVDDCFVQHFGTPGNITTRSEESKPHLDEAHYWYVEGNKYFFTTTLTGFTYKTKLDFDLIKTDPNIVLSGMQKDSKLNIKKIEWLSTETGFHRNNYEAVLPTTDKETDDGGNTIDKISDYEFDIQIGGNDITDWKYDMPRYTDLNPTTGKKIENDHLPQLNIRLQDKLDNSGDAAYINHLDEPELVKIYLVGETIDENGNLQNYEYTITVNIVYLQGPTVTGGVKIKNCALPGELIEFSTDGLEIKTPELMPITAASWQILPLSEIDEHGEWKWDMDHGIVIPDSRYNEDPETQHVEGTIPAYYKQNEYTIAYIFTAGGYDFPVMPAQHVLYATASEYNSAKGTSLTPEEFRALPENQKIKSTPAKENRMIVVHNYHRMKDVVPQDLQIETMPSTIPDNQTGTYHPKFAEAKLYIEDEEDLRAFVNYLNMATAGNTSNIPEGLNGLDIIMQKDITLTQPLPAITQAFAGTFHGDGYHIDLNGNGDSFLGSSLTGSVYNLGLVGGTIATTGTRTNCYELKDANDLNVPNVLYGHLAYELSHVFNPTTDHADYADYVTNRYANGDYQYASTNRVWSLRTAAPNYGHEETRHNMAHTHDANRWNETDGINKPLYDGTLAIADNTIDISGTGTGFFTYRGLPENYANDYLFFGQHLDRDNADAYPVHIEPIAKGDPNYTKGGNRVYKTSGFYGSAVDNSFYYNKDAWALQPTLTAIDFTLRNPRLATDEFGYQEENDNAPTTPTSFHVDSNADYCGDTYDNQSYGHVSQNLLVYRENSYDYEHDATGYTSTPETYENIFAAGKYSNNTPENKIRYHLLRNKINEGYSFEDSRTGTFITDYFHLVDCQDYHAPKDFFVDKRAWYERLPLVYRNANPYGEGSAWEGLCLPFTFVTRVYGEQSGNELSHFYGVPTTEMLEQPANNDRTLHHEYWLTGLTSATSGNVNFARPSSEGGDGLFTDAKQYNWTSYAFNNTHYNSLQNYSSPDGGHYDTRNDVNWYASPHTFSQYPHITMAMPYLVAFPGEDFYEFDLTDQKITFEFISPRFNDAPTYPIAATGSSDNYANYLGYPDLTTTVNGHSHVGTYMHVDADAQHLGINAAGSAFDVAAGHILPFRTYMTSTSAPSRSYVICAGKDGDVPTPNIPIDTEEETEPVPFVPTITITLNGTEVTVNSTYEENMPVKVYTVAGQYITTHTATPGISKFKLPQPGFYIINKKKVSTAR